MISLSPEAQERVNSLYQQDELITARKVVSDAKNPKSPLHKYFQWDIQKAAYRHWLHTARTIIRSVTIDITVENKTIQSVAYLRDPQQKSGYAHVGRLRTNRESAAETLRTEVQRVSDCLRRVKEVASSLGLAREVGKLLAQANAMEVLIIRRGRIAVPRPTVSVGRVRRTSRR